MEMTILIIKTRETTIRTQTSVLTKTTVSEV